MPLSKINANSINTGIITPTLLDVANQDGTGAMTVPTGTTAQRPAANTTGAVRYNTTLKALEFNDGNIWNKIAGSADQYYSSTKVIIKNGSLVDSSNSRRTLTNGGGASSSSSVGFPPVTKGSSLSGSAGNSWYVDGNSSTAYVSFGGSLSDFDMGQSAWTLEFWIYMPSGVNSYAHIFWCGGQSAQGEVKCGNDYKPYIYSGAGQAIQSSAAVTANAWTYVVFERYNGTISCWINGANRSQSSTMPTGGTPSVAAIGYPFNAEYYGHYLDEVRWSTTARYQGATTIPVQTTSWPEY
jgi:hypothetical protein